jgi:HlyD family secretion protein
MKSPEPSGADSVRSTNRRDIDNVLGGIQGAPRHWFSRATLWTAAAIVAIGLLVAYWLWGSAQSAVRYVTEPASRGSLTVMVTATGSAQPTHKVEVSSELSGTIRKVLVDYNNTVSAGDVLAELDLDKLTATAESSRAKLAAARAKVTETVATIEEKRADYERKRLLAARQITSAQELEVSKAAYDRSLASHANALAEVAVAEADLRVSEMNLKKACICSPINGVVLERNVDPGQTVAVSLQAPVLFTIAEDLKQMELQVDVDEADVGKTKVGQRATFTVDAYPERKFQAEVRDIRFASETVQGVVTYKALLKIDNSNLLIRPGMTATAEIVVNQVSDALLVPNAATRFTPVSTPMEPQRSLLERLLPRPPRRAMTPASTRQSSDPLSRTVWVLRDGTPVEVPVVIGDTDGRRTEIVKGELAAGEPVIIDSITASR